MGNVIMKRGSRFSERPNQKYIPSLSSLITFERVAAHASIAEAARDIGKTPSAVSRSLKELEARFDATLFRREGKSLHLTRRGVYYLKEVRKALEILEGGAELVSKSREKPAVRLHVSPFFASTILIPNLAEFYKDYPDMLLDINIDPVTANWADGEVDVEVRMCGNKDDSLYVRKLKSFQTVPICSPRLIKEKPKDISRLSEFTLLHLSAKPDIWPHWLKASDFSGLQVQRNLSLNSVTAIHEAVRNDLGVGLSIYPYVTTVADYGQNITMLFEDYDIGYYMSYNILCREASRKERDISLVTDWLEYAFDKTMGMPVAC